MQIFVRKWGDSMGIRIPMDFCRKLQLQPGSRVEMSLKGNKIMLTPKLSKLDELLENMTPDTFHDSLWDDTPQGKEEW